MKPIKKAIFPVAGLGTRFLPATKANPKEMLPIVDKPLIQYAVEEAVAAGIIELIFVSSSSKRAIEDHFDSNYELESKLEERHNYKGLSMVRGILPNGVSCAYIRQPNPMGLGHAVLCAKNLVGNEPFAVLLADDLIYGKNDTSCLAQMLPVFEKQQSSVLAVQPIASKDTKRYGIVQLNHSDNQIKSIVEKPEPEQAPSNLAVLGRYILTPRIFDILETTPIGQGGEIQLTDAISRLLNDEAVYAYELQGKRYDCGDKLGYIQATLDYALRHSEIADGVKKYLHEKWEILASEKACIE